MTDMKMRMPEHGPTHKAIEQLPEAIDGLIRFLPPLTVTVGDYKRLVKLVLDRVGQEPQPAWTTLLNELERASVVADDGARSTTVKMHSTVAYRDEMASEVNVVQLVYPDEADGHLGRLSVLTPIGAALVGLNEGQQMLWINAQGRRNALTVLEVRDGLV